MRAMKRLGGLMYLRVALGLVLLGGQTVFADNPGEATYKAKCAMCHGADGKGETSSGKAMKVRDFASEDVQKQSDSDLSDTISKGKGKMPAYKTLTADQVKDLVSYVRAFGKKK